MPPDPPPVDQLLDTALELVGVVHDYGPDATADLLDQLTPGDWYRLAIACAAMVDPDKTPGELLGWLEQPLRSRPFEPASIRPDLAQRTCPDCGRRCRASHLARHRRTHSTRAA